MKTEYGCEKRAPRPNTKLRVAFELMRCEGGALAKEIRWQTGLERGWRSEGRRFADEYGFEFVQHVDIFDGRPFARYELRAR